MINSDSSQLKLLYNFNYFSPTKMRRNPTALLLLSVLISGVYSGFVFAQTAHEDSAAINQFPLAENTIPHGATQNIELLDFKNTDIRDVVRAIASKYALNIFVENGIDYRITVHLVDIPVYDALKFIAKEYGLRLERDGAIFKFERPFVLEPEPEPLSLFYENGLLSLDLKEEALRLVAEEISKYTGNNVIVNRGAEGSITCFMQRVPFEQALQILMSTNGFSVREKDGVYLVDKANQQHDENSPLNNGRSFWVGVKDSLVTLDVTRANIRDVLREIFLQIGFDLVVYDEIKGELTARCSNVTLDSALSYLLRGTEYSYHQENGVYLIGGESLQGITSSKLIRLNHLQVDNVVELLPQNITKQGALKVIKEHNGLVVTGSQELIKETESFIREIDRPIPQVLIEALVVDFNRQHVGEFGIKAGIGAAADSGASIVSSLFPVVDVSVSGAQINNILDVYQPFGLSRIAKLPDNFYLQIKAMENQGKANVRSRPQIATLSGHTASISIGTTQYFILRTETPIPGSNQVVLQESERFETIKAELKLEVTPWVTATGEIITEIHPEFSTPKNGLNSDTPPTIDHRVLDSTVKLKDGETIVLGGLIQEFDTESITKFPILGHIPLLGQLFQNRSYNKSSSELIIYLTPHVYYVGDAMQGVIQ